MKKLCILAAILFAVSGVQAVDLSADFINLDFDAGGVSNPFHGFDEPESPEIIGWGNWKNGAYTNYLNDAGVEGPGAWWAPYENNAAFISASDGATNLSTYTVTGTETFTIDFWCKRWEWTSGTADGALTAVLYYDNPANVIGSVTVTNLPDNSHWEQRIGYIDAIPAAAGGKLGVYMYNSLADGDICNFDELQVRVDPFIISGIAPTGLMSETNLTIEATITNINGSAYTSSTLYLDDFIVDSDASGGSVRTLSFNTDLTLGVHTAKVVAISSTETMTNQWTFEVQQPAFGDITYIPGWWWIVHPIHWAQSNIEMTVIEDFCEVSNVTASLNGVPLTPSVDRSMAPTTTVTIALPAMTEGYYTSIVEVAGTPYGYWSNQWVFIYVDEDTNQPISLVHHWAFDGVGGTNVTDSVGGAHGAIIGTNYTWTGSGLDLGGQGNSWMWNSPTNYPPLGTNTVGAFVDLPNGIASLLPASAVTFEAVFISDDWNDDWAKVFDFGESDSLNGEGYSGIGGSGTSLCPDANWLDELRFEVTAGFPGWQNVISAINVGGPVYGEVTHVVVIYDSVNGRNLMYRNGVLVGAQVTLPGLPYALGSINDINCWFGRSQYNDDRMFDGTLEDIRIYTGAMTTEEVRARYEEVTPFVATKIPNIQSLTMAGGMATLVWDSEADATYYVLTKSALSDPAWTTNGSGVISAGDATTSTSVTAGVTAEFYMIEGRP